MANETGHARNVQSFETLLSFVNGYGVAYAPTNPNLVPASLNATLIDAKSKIQSVTAALAPSKMAINNRETAFAPIKKLATRVVNYYESTGTAANNVADVKTFSRKIQGTRASAPIPDDPNTPEDESAGNNSASQQSFTQIVQHLDNMVGVLEGDVMYVPAEADLTIATLQTLSINLKIASTAVINAFIPLSNARLNRDKTLYKEKIGLVDTAGLVKKYVKAVFGADSPQYQQVSGLKFTQVS